MCQALQALRGVGLVVAATLAAEIGDLGRFDTPKQLMGWLGLVPSEASSGARTRRGAITKTGNREARAMLVEAGKALPKVITAIARELVGFIWDIGRRMQPA